MGKKKEKIVYVDDGSTIADMSHVSGPRLGRRHPAAPHPKRQTHCASLNAQPDCEPVACWVSSGVTAAVSASVKAHGSGFHQAPLRMAR